jgi:hypothetical protein
LGTNSQSVLADNLAVNAAHTPDQGRNEDQPFVGEMCENLLGADRPVRIGLLLGSNNTSPLL